MHFPNFSAMALRHTRTQAQLSSLLYYGVLKGSKRLIESTLEAGAELIFNDHMPLRIAVNTGQVEIVKLLISRYDVDTHYATIRALRDHASGLYLSEIAACLRNALGSAKIVPLDLNRKKFLAPAA